MNERKRIDALKRNAASTVFSSLWRSLSPSTVFTRVQCLCPSSIEEIISKTYCLPWARRPCPYCSCSHTDKSSKLHCARHDTGEHVAHRRETMPVVSNMHLFTALWGRTESGLCRPLSGPVVYRRGCIGSRSV